MGNGIGRGALLASVAIVWVAAASPAAAQSKTFAVPPQAAASGIAELGRQADIQIVAARRYTQNKRANAVRGAMTVDRALVILLDGTGLVARHTGAQTYSVVPASPAAQPREGNAASIPCARAGCSTCRSPTRWASALRVRGPVAKASTTIVSRSRASTAATFGRRAQRWRGSRATGSAPTSSGRISYRCIWGNRP